MQVAEDRPPYVSFEIKAIEDRTASIAKGHYVTKDVDFAVITPQGSKDRTEREVTDWFAQMENQVQEQRFPRPWLLHFRASYTAWKEGQELPATGTPIVTWPVLLPSQVRSCIDARVRSVEDLATANEETLARIGMGGRTLKTKAVSWLAAASENGKVAEELTALKAAKADADRRAETLERQLRELQAQVTSLTAKK